MATKADGLSALILEATAQGYDVEIRMRLRDDGQEGQLRLPIPWARRLGYDPGLQNNPEST